jgi:competence protein ComEC
MTKWKSVFIFLVLAAATTWLAVAASPDGNFRLIACDVGEGDAILATYKNIQILTDGGPNNKVLDCLSRHMPFFDRKIEMVILTHPDADHYRGLIEVVRRYQVDSYLYNNFTLSSSDYGVLENEVGSRGIRSLHPAEGMKIRIGKIYLDILKPKIIVPDKTNENSIVNLISIGSFKALLTGDMVPAVSEELANNWPFGTLNYIKIPHHGSKNGLTEKLLEVLRPALAVISVGKNNYGHPDNGILELLKKYNVRTLRTDDGGDIEIISDGKTFRLTGQK